MDVERQRCDLAQRRNHRHTNGDVGNEVPVHHVDVDLIGAAGLDLGDLIGKAREVGGENRRGDPQLHRVTSSEIASLGVI